jgi:hypothetical protein
MPSPWYNFPCYFLITVIEACALPGEKRKRKGVLLGIEANEPAMIRPDRITIPTMLI